MDKDRSRILLAWPPGHAAVASSAFWRRGSHPCTQSLPQSPAGGRIVTKDKASSVAKDGAPLAARPGLGCSGVIARHIRLRSSPVWGRGFWESPAGKGEQKIWRNPLEPILESIYLAHCRGQKRLGEVPLRRHPYPCCSRRMWL